MERIATDKGDFTMKKLILAAAPIAMLAACSGGGDADADAEAKAASGRMRVWLGLAA